MSSYQEAVILETTPLWKLKRSNLTPFRDFSPWHNNIYVTCCLLRTETRGEYNSHPLASHLQCQWYQLCIPSLWWRSSHPPQAQQRVTCTSTSPGPFTGWDFNTGLTFLWHTQHQCHGWQMKRFCPMLGACGQQQRGREDNQFGRGISQNPHNLPLCCICIENLHAESPMEPGNLPRKEHN